MTVPSEFHVSLLEAIGLEFPHWSEERCSKLADDISQRQKIITANQESATTHDATRIQFLLLDEVVDRAFGHEQVAGAEHWPDWEEAIGGLVPFLCTADRRLVSGYAFECMELLVGEALSAGMSDDLMAEFEAFIDRNEIVVHAWFAAHDPDWLDSPQFKRFRNGHPGASELDVLAEYGSLRWLEMNRPDYRQVVAESSQLLLDAIRHLVRTKGPEAFLTRSRIHLLMRNLPEHVSAVSSEHRSQEEQ